MKILTRFLNLKIARFGPPHRHSGAYKTKLYERTKLIKPENQFDRFVKKIAPKLIYNSVIETTIIQNNFYIKKNKHLQRSNEELVPLVLSLNSEKDEENKEIESNPVHFPYTSSQTLEQQSPEPELEDYDENNLDVASKANEEVRKRYEMKNWMASYDNYDDTIEDDEIEDWKINYGTPDPRSHISKTPCGGCGALLHCKDTAIPGYIPSEIFKNCFVQEGVKLNSIICQRCHFLKNYNLALQVQVNPDDYPRVLKTVSRKKGLVLLMVDLLDFPCSIWPGIGEIFGKLPIFVVGNKVDLLPQDSPKFLKQIREVLLKTMKAEGFATFNIKDVALISAKTGYGIEDLITKLHSINYKGDVYIVGCTNVGKSTLFNVFLQSDYCKTQAIDLIQRATTSVWPGTTLNLLKFPIKRPSGYRQYLRQKRLDTMNKIQKEEEELRRHQLRTTKHPKFATLIGHIDITKNPETYSKSDDDVIINQPFNEFGFNENRKEFVDSKWCFDTPGVVQPDQLIHLLTTDELLLTLPRRLILPRSFCIRPKSSIFIAGLARLDFIEGDSSARLAVFASNDLPITVCSMDDADEVYDELLGTELFKVPEGNQERLLRWPKLEKGKEFSVTGLDWSVSVSDIVLSSAGWIALTGKENMKYTFRAWTPEKRGIHLRDSILPHAVAYSGHRIKGSVAYTRFRFFTQ